MHVFDVYLHPFLLTCLMHAMPCTSFCMTLDLCGFKAAFNAFQGVGTHCFLCYCQLPVLLCCAAFSLHSLLPHIHV